MRQRVLIVIPAYNEEKTITNIILGLRQAVPDFDRIVVNDGSKDSTSGIVTGLGEKQLKLSCNLGYGRSLQAGFKYALMRGYNIIVSFDADGQHQPEDVSRLVEALCESRADMVIGSRFCSDNTYRSSLVRRLGQLLFSHLTRLLIGQRIYDTTSGLKALRADACEVLVNASFMDFHIETLVRLSLLGFKILEIPVIVKERTFGVSMHSFASVFQYPLKTLLLTIVATADALLTRRMK